MTVHLSQDVANDCVGSCSKFVESVLGARDFDFQSNQATSTADSFDTARQLGAVYALFAEEDLRTLLSGFVDQAKAMSMLFAAAGGLIESQDEAVAAALGKAAQEPAGMQSLGLLAAVGPVLSPTGLSVAAVADAVGSSGYDRVGPEDVSGAPLERMASGARALDEAQFRSIAECAGGVAESLEGAADQLRSELTSVLGEAWQGEFAEGATRSVQGLTGSARDLAGSLREVESKATVAADGFGVTRSRIGEDAGTYEVKAWNTPGYGGSYGPVTESTMAEMAAARHEAEEQARAVINTEYSPAVMDANLAGLEFPTAYRVVSSGAVGGPGGIALDSAWNTDGTIRPARPGAPSEAAIAAATGGAAGGGTPGTAGGGNTSGATPVVAAAPVDAATEQALLASRSGGADGLGAGAGAGAGTGPAAGGVPVGGTGAGAAGVNPGTAAASAAPLMNTSGQPGVAAGAGALGSARVGARQNARSADRGFNSASGMLAGGGAAAAGAGAATRMGGAGTLSGLGAPGLGGPGGSGGAAGAGTPGLKGGPAGPGALTANAAGAGGPAGAGSASNTAGGRVGGMPMGMMGGAGAGHGDKRDGHRPASYLVNATNTSEILGEPTRVAPAVIGGRRDVEPPPVPTPPSSPREVSPAQALVDKLKGRQSG